MSGLWRLLAAPGTALACLLAAPVVLALADRGLLPWFAPFLALAGLGLCLTTCTIRRWRYLRRSTLLVHLGMVVILAGGVLSTRGWVATRNIYPGDTVARFYRWDRRQDMDAGFTVTVRAVRPGYFPSRLRIGVLKDGAKYQLVECRSDEVVTVDDLELRVTALDPQGPDLLLAVRHGGKETTLHPGDPLGPYVFQLVAFQQPALRQIEAELLLAGDGGPPTTATVAVNRPVSYHGVQISFTNFAHDDKGHPYIGLQLARDPGRPVVYTGFFLLAAGAVWGLARLGRKG